MNRRQFFKICSAGLGGSSIAVMGFADSSSGGSAGVQARTRHRNAGSTCPYCSVACGLLVYSTGDKSKNSKGTIIHVEGDPTTRQPRHAVPEGRWRPDMMQSKDRLKWPEVREPGSNEWKRISWHDAIERIAKHMKADRDKNFVAQNKDGVTRTVGRLCCAGGFCGHQ